MVITTAQTCVATVGSARKSHRNVTSPVSAIPANSVSQQLASCDITPWLRLTWNAQRRRRPKSIGVAAGYSWAGTSELKQMWIDETYRGRGYARELLNAFVAEAANRGFRRIWVASYDFQSGW